MIIVCPACSGRFQYDDARFEGVASKHFRCTKCSNVFELANPKESGAAPRQGLRAQEGDRPRVAQTGGHPYIDRDPLAPRCGMRLVCLTGPRASASLELTKPRTVIGRDEGDVITKDPETSKRHAMIEVMEDGTAWLSDLGSRNGTFIQGTPVAGKVQLADRQEFTCGRSAFMLSVT
jgi:predicted Zn finger-like uncharacterized protein